MGLSRQAKVGVFVLVGLACMAAIVFMIGDNRMLFDTKVEFSAYFENVQGLQGGSTIRMGGVDVGTVRRVRYSDDPSEPRIEVRLGIVRREAPRVLRDSEARVVGKGMLGDKMVIISSGTPGSPPAAPGQVLRTRPSEDLANMLGRLDAISGKTEGLVDNLQRATAPLAEAELQESLRGSVAALQVVLTSLATGEGYATRLLRDGAEAQRLSELAEALSVTGGSLTAALRTLNVSLNRINTGPGLAHEVLYGAGSEQVVAQAGQAFEELSLTLRAIREGNGVAHALLFGGEGPEQEAATQALVDLAASAESLKKVLAEVEAGRGTLGALVTDPSVYEDLKLLLGNVQRSSVLRALMRFAIRNSDAEQVEAVDP